MFHLLDVAGVISRHLSLLSFTAAKTIFLFPFKLMFFKSFTSPSNIKPEVVLGT